MLNRNLKSKISRAVFFDEYNEIDIYIEDTAKGYKKLFLKLLQRILGEQYKIENIFPLGGRGEVLQACSSDQESRDRARIYIIDGDLYLLAGETDDVHLKGLFVLPRYCIENHLLCELSLLNIMDEEETDKSFETIENLFNFEGWVDAVKVHLVDLFIEYAVAKKIAPTVQTVAFGYSGLVSSNSGEVDSSKVDLRILDVKTAVIEIAGQYSYESTKHEIKQLVAHDKNSLLSVVSGKDILMPLLLMRCKKFVPFKITNLALKMRVANVCNLESMSMLPSFINNE